MVRYKICWHERGWWLGNPRGISGFARANYFLLLFVVFSASAFPQKKQATDSVAHFKVKYTTADYTFFPADAYLFVSNRNKIRITNSRHTAFEVKATNGSVTKVNDSTFVIDGLVNMGNTLVSIFETDASGKKKLVANKPYTVVSYPKVKFAGVPCDSAAPAIKLAAGSLNVYYKSTSQKVPVTSFKMEFYEKEKFVLDSSVNNRLSKKMLAYVEKLKPGSLLYLSNIKYKDPNGNEQTEPVYRVFIIKESGQIKFGLNN